MVNKSDRKPYSKKEMATIEDLKVTQKRPVRVIIPLAGGPLETKQLSFECIDEDFLKKTCASIYDNDNHFEKFERKLHSIIGNVIQQVFEKKSIIHVPTNLNEKSNECYRNFAQTTLKHFLPTVEEKVVLAASESVQFTTSGLFHCVSMGSCFQYKNVLDQAEKILFFPSKKHIQFFLDLPYNLREIEPVTPAQCDTYISPYAKSQEDEELVSNTVEKTKILLKDDIQLSHLLNLLALFTPVNVDMSIDDLSLFKYFQEKITMMMYTHLMKR